MPVRAEQSSRSEASAPTICAECAVLMDMESGRVLYQKNAHARGRIASTTKILTGLLACELLSPEQIVCVPDEAVGIEGSSMYLQAGECLRVRDLLYGLLLSSGNDAAVALALACDGTVEQFAARMNARAAKLGMENSHFCNPSGLDEDGHFSSAYDLALLSRAAMRNETFQEIVGTKTMTIGSRTFQNHNRLLWSYSGANGIKTGYTRAAGRVLVSSAKRAGTTLLAVTICDPEDWVDHTALLDYGFSAFEHRCILRQGESIGSTAVIGGDQTSVSLYAGNSIRYPFAAGETWKLQLHAPRFVYAPVLYGSAGYMELLVNGVSVSKTPVFYRHPVAALPEQGFWKRLLGG